MYKDEFLKACEKYTVGAPYIYDQDFSIIRYVFEWYPTLNKAFAIDQIAMLYSTFGMDLIKDMQARAAKNEKLHITLREAQANIESITNEIKELEKVKL